MAVFTKPRDASFYFQQNYNFHFCNTNYCNFKVYQGHSITDTPYLIPMETGYSTTFHMIKPSDDDNQHYCD